MQLVNAMINNDDEDDDQKMMQLQAAMSKLVKTKEQQKVRQKNECIQRSKKKLQDMLSTSIEKYKIEEAELERNIASKLSESSKAMAGVEPNPL